MSQAELARLVGVDHTLVSRLESGARNPSRQVVARLARVLAGDDSELAVRLFASAGYAPLAVGTQADVGQLWQLIALMSDDRLPDPARRLASAIIDSLAETLRSEIDRQTIRGNGWVADTSEGGCE
jgi:transcriptional regulator with XRE-family HTH domain